MSRNRDLFDDTTMSFGEHLEVLRVHLWKALLGTAVAVVFCLFYGNVFVDLLRQPINDALRRANMPQTKDDLSGIDFGGFLKSLFAGEEKKEATEQEPVLDAAEPEFDPESTSIHVMIPLESLTEAIRRVAPDALADPVADKPPAAEPPGTTQEGPAETAGSAETPADPPAEVTVPLEIRSPDFAMLKQAADRFNRPVTFKVEEAFMTYIKISLVAGAMLASPWIFYQIWQFVAAGLYRHERKFVYIYLPMSLGLFFLGAWFCFHFVFPIVLDFLISFNKWLGVELQPRLSEYINLVLMLPAMFGISFQLPLVMLFMERINIMTVETYLKNWRMAVLVIAIASMILTPSDPTSMLLMMGPMIFLYFGGILLCRFRPGRQADPLAG